MERTRVSATNLISIRPQDEKNVMEEGITVEESVFSNKKFQLAVKIITAASFTLFTVYQCLLAIQIETNRIGRFIMIGLYLLLTVASYLAFPDKYGVWVAHSVLFVAGLILLFALRLVNLPTIIENVDPSYPPTVWYLFIYGFTQLGSLVLVAGYLSLRADLEAVPMKRLITVLMTVAIVLFVAVYIMETFLLLKYHYNIDYRLSHTLISRVLFCLGYVGTAVSFLLPAPHREEEKKPGEFLFSEEDEDELDLII